MSVIFYTHAHALLPINSQTQTLPRVANSWVANCICPRFILEGLSSQGSKNNWKAHRQQSYALSLLPLATTSHQFSFGYKLGKLEWPFGFVGIESSQLPEWLAAGHVSRSKESHPQMWYGWTRSLLSHRKFRKNLSSRFDRTFPSCGK